MYKKLKVGDKVQVREDLIVGESYGNDSYISDMDKLNLKGKLVTICHAEYGIDWADEDDIYYLEEDNQRWRWTSKMFVIDSECKLEMKLEDEVKNKFQDEVKIFTYNKYYVSFTEHSNTTGELKKGAFSIPERTQKVIHSKNATIVILDDGSKGIAKCCKDDEYNKTTGIKIAYTRAKIKSLQKELKKLIK
jgi:hypothetical protein